MKTSLPLPSLALMDRVGVVSNRPDATATYLQIGAANRAFVLSLLPEGFSLQGRRVLDFGCGAGRVLRHFVEQRDPGDYWGCDIDEPSIAWLNQHLSPPAHGFACGEVPPLPIQDRFFGLIYAISVFTHITTLWSAWLLELHRVLTDDGILIASFLGEGMAAGLGDEPWDENVIGMRWARVARPWSEGGPDTYLSPWWIRAHWGRAFDVVALFPHGTALPLHRFPVGTPPDGHGMVVMRKRPGTFTTADLERPEPGEIREVPALAAALRRLHDEYSGRRAEFESLANERAEAASYRASLEALQRSRSVRLTAPLRHVARVLRRYRKRPEL